MCQVDGRRVASHRRIDEDIKHRNGPLLFQAAQAVEDFLRASNRESRNHEQSASAGGRVHRIRQLVRWALLSVQSIAIGTFSDQSGCEVNRLGRMEQRPLISTQIASEDDRLLFFQQLEAADGGAEDVSGAPKGERHSWKNLLGLTEAERLKQSEGRLRIFDGIERQRWLMFAVALLVGIARFLFLQVR